MGRIAVPGEMRSLQASVVVWHPFPETSRPTKKATTPIAPAWWPRLEALQRRDDRVRHIACAGGLRLVAVRAEIVRDLLALPDHLRDRGLDPLGGILLTQVAKHHHAREQHRGRVRHVLARVARRGTMDRLEHGCVLANIAAR